MRSSSALMTIDGKTPKKRRALGDVVWSRVYSFFPAQFLTGSTCTLKCLASNLKSSLRIFRVKARLKFGKEWNDPEKSKERDLPILRSSPIVR